MRILLSFSFLICIYLPLHARSNPSCHLKNNPFNTLEVLQASCLAIKDSADCKNLYSQIDKTAKSSEEADYQKLKCDKKTIENRMNFSFTSDILIACAAAVIVDPIKDLGIFVKDSAAKASVNWDKARECDKSFEQKVQLIHAHNLDMPKIMSMKIPSKEKLAAMSCNQIHVTILNHKQTKTNAFSRSLNNKALSPTQKASLTKGEIEFLEYDKKRLGGVAGSKGSGLYEMVENLYNQMITKDKCYSPEQTAKLRCEIAATVASVTIPGLFAIRAAKLAKLSNLKVEEVLEKINNADRATAGVSGRIVNPLEKSEILSASGKLSNSERVKVVESLFNKKLSQNEKDQLIKMHDVGSSEGRGFSALTKADKDKKRELARAINPDTGKPYFTNEEFNALMRNGITGITGKEDLRLQSMKMMADSFDRQNTAQMTEAFKIGNGYYKNYLDLPPEAFKKALGNSRADDLLISAATGGLKPDEVLALANKISKVEGGDHADNLAQLSARLADESVRLTELTKNGTQVLQNEFRQYMLLESRFKIEQEYVTTRFGDKFGDIDFDKFEVADPDGLDRYQKISEELSKARKAAEKKKWPHKEADNSY